MLCPSPDAFVTPNLCHPGAPRGLQPHQLISQRLLPHITLVMTFLLPPGLDLNGWAGGERPPFPLRIQFPGLLPGR